jgi:Zinc finger, C2H2 type
VAGCSPSHASAIENGSDSPQQASRPSISLPRTECAAPSSPPVEPPIPASPVLTSPSRASPDPVPYTPASYTPASPVIPVLPREEAVPQGRRFAAMLLRNLVYLISVVRIGRHIVMIDLYHVTSDPLAVDIEGRHCNNSIHIMYDPTGMMFGCLSDSTQCISETLTFLEEVCTVCDVPKAQCPCQSEQVVCANCTSFADLSSRLRGGSTWRHSHMNCERVSLRRSAAEGQQMRRMRTSIWLESVDGLSPHPRTAEMRRRFFNFNGMLVSSPHLIQPSQTFEVTDGDSSVQADANDTSSSVKGTTQELCALQYACPSCPKVFIRKAGLQRHKRTVHGPRRHECEQCGAKFQQGAHLKTHQVLVHAKSLNFVCDQCGMRFPLRSRLNTHLKSKHGMSAK